MVCFQCFLGRKNTNRRFLCIDEKLIPYLETIKKSNEQGGTIPCVDKTGGDNLTP